MKRISFEDAHCSIARTLELVGDWWTLLIVRDVALGLRRFDQIQSDLGISRNVLTDRLERLVDSEILQRHNIAATGTRWEYRLTEKGRDLQGVLVALLQWGDRWNPDPAGPYTELVHTGCGHAAHFNASCSHCGEVVSPTQIRSSVGAAFESDETHPIARAQRARERNSAHSPSAEQS